MGRGDPITQSARSPDLNVFDYFVWGHIKDLIKHRHDDLEHEVRDEITAAFNTNTGHGTPCNVANSSKSRTLFTSMRKAFRTIVALNNESELGLLGKSLKKNQAIYLKVVWKRQRFLNT